jgi:hypothetical protein
VMETFSRLSVSAAPPAPGGSVPAR